MKYKWVMHGLLAGLVLLAGLSPTFAGDSLYGKVTAVPRADLVVLDYGAGRYNVRLIGIDVPRERGVSNQARQFVARLVLGKNARIRFDHRAQNGDMVSRLFTDDPDLGIKDVGVELVKAGWARRQANYDYKYGELAAAETEARAAKRGLWSSNAPR